MRRINIPLPLVLATILGQYLATTPAGAQEEEVDVAVIVEGRQSNLRDLGAAFKAINDELKKSSPLLPVIQQYARQIDDLAKQQRFWFPPGSGPQPGVDTKAKPEIWTRSDDFGTAQAALTREAATMLQTAEGKDIAAIKQQQRALGKTCEGCHRPFRVEED